MKTDASSVLRVRPAANFLLPRIATFLFNYVQIGLVVAVSLSQVNRGAGVLVLVAFEIGILLDCFLRGGSMFVWALVAVGSGLGLFAAEAFQSANYSLALSAISACLLAMSLKKIRTSTDALGKIKRRWRALGYLSAGFYSPIPVVALAILIMAVVHLSRVSERGDKPLPVGFRVLPYYLRPYVVVMLHHVHYFSYAYLVILILHSRYGLESALLGPLFYVGWAGYYLFIRVTRHQRLLVVVGHILSGVSVLCLVPAESLGAVLALWFVTGVGGGTIVLLREVHVAGDEVAYERFKIWEAFGHVLGLCTLAGAVFAGFYPFAFVVGGLAGLACAVGAAAPSRLRATAGRETGSGSRPVASSASEPGSVP